MKRIRLSRTRPGERWALVDDADFGRISRFAWTYTERPRGYPCAVTTILGRIVPMHRLILGFPDGDTDHINGDRLDNRRENLRIIQHAANLWNSITKVGRSGRRGVCATRSGRWRAQIRHAGRSLHIGTFDSVESAAMAYDAAVERLRDGHAVRSDNRRR